MSDSSQILVFDRSQVRRQRDRAARGFAAHRPLFDESGEALAERLRDVKRAFGTALDLGAHTGGMASRLTTHGVPFVVAADMSIGMARQASALAVVADEEGLPFAAESFDLIVSNLSLHWVNDLPGALAQIRQSLRPGGLFLAALLGGATLYELRDCLMEAEINVTGGVSPRLAPTIELQTASRLLLRAGFHLPVADQERVIMEYADTKSLLLDLRGMGETNAHAQRPKHFTRRRILRGAARLYEARYSGGEGGIKATFDMLFLHGWKNDRPQQGAISSGTHN